MGNIGEKLSGANECCASPKRHQPPGTLGPQDKAKMIQSIEGIIRSTEACVRVPEWSMEWEHIPHHKPFAFSTIDTGLPLFTHVYYVPPSKKKKRRGPQKESLLSHRLTKFSP